jgi:hypothetical protein
MISSCGREDTYVRSKTAKIAMASEMLSKQYVNGRGRPFVQLFQRIPQLEFAYSAQEANYDVGSNTAPHFSSTHLRPDSRDRCCL